MNTVKAIYGPFIVHLCTLKPFETTLRPMIEGRKRVVHTNALAICSGWLVLAGDGSEWIMRPGEADDELPDYPKGWQYQFAAGDEGAEFFCIGRFPPGVPFLRQRIEVSAGEELFVKRGALCAIYSGDGPRIVDATIADAILTTSKKSKVLMMRLGEKVR